MCVYVFGEDNEKYDEYNIQAEDSPQLDAKLSDICIGSSAAPTYFPGHFFENSDDKGNTFQFNLIDGGVCANNPVSMSI